MGGKYEIRAWFKQGSPREDEYFNGSTNSWFEKNKILRKLRKEKYDCIVVISRNEYYKTEE